MRMKRIIATVMVWVMIVPLLPVLPAIPARAAESNEIMVSSLVAYTPKEQILKRINEIRKEACEEGITFEGKTLKPSDYVEITWSTDMEEIAMKRAVEAYYSFSHTRPDGSSCFTAQSSTGRTSSSEILASMGNTLGDIELWYMEKEDLLKGQEDKAGHYIALIDPYYKSIGLASSGTTAGELSGESFVGTGRDEQIYNRNAYLNVEIAMDPDSEDLRIFGGSKVSTNGTNGLLFGLIVYNMMGWSYDILPVEDAEWKSSNAGIVSVDQKGTIAGHKAGKATITVSYGSFSRTKEVTAVNGQWVKNAKGWWFNLLDGDYPASQTMTINGRTYYFDSNGYMATGWKKIYGDWYYFGDNGAMRKDWQKIGGKWYYLTEEGIMLTNWQKIGGKWYYLGANGAMRSGWQKINNKWYYLGVNGAMQTGWQRIGGKWFYMGDDGVMQTGWKKINNKWYYFNANGAMQTGWQKINGKWYYLGVNGDMAAGKWIGNYYLGEDGVMATNQWIGQYYVGADGRWVKGKTK